VESSISFSRKPIANALPVSCAIGGREVRSKCTRRFWKLHDALPPHVQKLARKSYDLWRRDPN
jgi:hypothetical protein